MSRARLPTPATLASLAALLALAACGPLVTVGGSSAPPSELFALRAAAGEPGTAAPSAARPRTVLVETPLTPGSLRTLRVPVTLSDTRIVYLKDANWVEPPARQFQRLLIELAGRGGAVAALDPRVYDGPVELRLSGTLLDLGLDVRDASAPRAVARYDAILTGPAGALVAARRFEASRPTASDRPAAVAEALNAAANDVAAAAAQWATQSRPG